MNTRLNQGRTGRLNLLERMMLVAVGTSHGSSCSRRAVGCVITDDRDRVVATGYNGAPRGTPHCIDQGCLLNAEGACVRCVHAELNACLQCTSDYATRAYCTDAPCLTCLRALMQKGIGIIYYWREYEDEDRARFLQSLPELDPRTLRPPIQLYPVGAYGERLPALLSDYDARITKEYEPCSSPSLIP